jgi:cytochrome c553
MKPLSVVSCCASAAIFLVSLSAAAASIEAGQQKAGTCFACHGANGNSISGLFPVLAGQNASYIYQQLKKFKDRGRVNPMMSPVAAALSDEDMQNMSAYFAVQKPSRLSFQPDPARVKSGALKADELMCEGCHLGGFAGAGGVPKLSGQQPDYIATQLHNFRSGERRNDDGNMNSIVQSLSDEDIVNLTHFIGSLP